MDYSERQTLYHRVNLGLTAVAYISVFFFVFWICSLFAAVTEKVESPGSHLFHSFVAGVASIGSACFGQAEIAVPTAVDSASQLFDFFGASSAKTAHEKRISSAENGVFWSLFFLAVSGGILLARKRIEDAIETRLLPWNRHFKD